MDVNDRELRAKNRKVMSSGMVLLGTRFGYGLLVGEQDDVSKRFGEKKATNAALNAEH